MLNINNLSKVYKLKGKLIEAVKKFNLDVYPGSVYCFLGPNGAGKTTTIKMLCGLVAPATGEIVYNSTNIVKDNREFLTKIGVVLEGARNVHWRLTPFENVEYFRRLHGLNRDINYISEWINLVGLDKYKDTQCRFLSRGNQQKVAIACALSLNADVLLLDEPTLGLDMEISRQMMELIIKEKNKNKIIIITTHDPEFIERTADKIIIFKKGKVFKFDEPNKIIEKYGTEDKRFSSAYINLIRTLND
ncbi:MAG: ABC transporter ATP-binding protein [Elusimicrobia bacterium]|nr:ABC transporter ATP-binding protein [Elusimicrobiota bacterium]